MTVGAGRNVAEKALATVSIKCIIRTAEYFMLQHYHRLGQLDSSRTRIVWYRIGI